MDQLLCLLLQGTFWRIVDVLCTKVGRHDNNLQDSKVSHVQIGSDELDAYCVAEVDRAALAVCQSTGIKDLQEESRELSAGLFDFTRRGSNVSWGL